MLELKEKGPLEPSLQVDHGQNVLTQSIAQNAENIPFSFETISAERIAIDSFSGKVRDFRSYLKANRRLLEAGVIAP